MSFRLKTILGVATIEIFLVAILIVSGLKWLEASYENDLKLRAKNLVETSAVVLRDPVVVLDLGTIQSFATEFIKNSNAKYIRIYNNNKLLIGEGEQTLIKKPFVRDYQLADVKDNIYDTSAELIIEGIRIGHVELGLSTNEIQQRYNAVLQKAPIIAGIGLLLSGLFSFALGSYLTRQLTRVQKATEYIRQGDFKHQIEVKGNDELADTARAFNKMANHISETYDELNNALARANAATQAKTDFLANMSHEIRTPLNGVYGMLTLLADTELTKQQQEWLSAGKVSAELLLSIINDILDFSKIEANKLMLEHSDFNLHQVVEDVAQMLSGIALQKNIEISSYIDNDVAEFIQGDSTRLAQVLTNLCANAVKFTEQGEVVLKVCTEQLNDVPAICIKVSDTGIGIDKDKIDSLFEEFSQEDTSTTRQFGGTGLGLAICSKLVGLMGGQIRVDSEKGVGSTFSFAIPYHPAKKAPLLQEFKLDEFDVLIVDDNKTNCMILEHYLDHLGIRSQTALNAVDALELIKQSQIDNRPFTFALIDCQMPEVDGVALAKLINEDTASKIKYSVLVSSANQTDITEIDKYFDASITKPVKRTTLYETLANVLNGSRANNANQHNPELSLFSGHVLLVEDNVVNQMLAQEMLRKHGLEVTTVENGHKAVLEAAMTPFDLILMDIQMPVMDGYESTRQIRNHEKRKNLNPTPIVALTANALKGDDETCFQAGMNDYISKPFSESMLLRVLQKYLVSELGPPETDIKAGPDSQDNALTN